MSLRSTDRSHNRPWLSQLRYRYRGRSLALLTTGRGGRQRCSAPWGSGHGRSAQPPSSRKAAQRRATREPRDHAAPGRRAPTVDRAAAARRRGCEKVRGRCAARPSGPGTAPRSEARATQPAASAPATESNGSSRWIRSRWLCCWRWPCPQTVRAADLHSSPYPSALDILYLCRPSRHLRRQERRRWQRSRVQHRLRRGFRGDVRGNQHLRGRGWVRFPHGQGSLLHRVRRHE